jgi:hypothetical protein
MTVGSVRKLTIEGISFPVLFDANLSDLESVYENSAIATSGKGMIKKVKRIPVIEGVILGCDGGSRIALISFADGIAELKFSIEYASGDIKKCQGIFNIGSYESDEGRETISIHPTLPPTLFTA